MRQEERGASTGKGNHHVHTTSEKPGMTKLWICLGMVFFALLAPRDGLGQGGRSPSRVSLPDVRLVGPPTWWIVPFKEGNTAEGKLYFGATVENRSDVVAAVGLSFQSYTAEGTRYEGCYEMGGGGPGVYDEVPPRGRAFLMCQRSIVPVDRAGLQVTSRMWDVRPVVVRTTAARVVEAGFQVAEEYLDATAYDAFALVRGPGARDVDVRVVFRFLAEDGTQVATCESGDVTIEPEVAQRVTCSSTATVVPGMERPVHVRAELRAGEW